MKQYKYQKLDVTIASGATAGFVSRGLKLDEQYQRVVGVKVRQIADGGLDRSAATKYYNLGYKNDSEQYVEVQHCDDLLSNPSGTSRSGVSVNDQYLDLGFEIRGQQAYIDIETKATLTSDLVLQVIFKLEKC